MPLECPGLFVTGTGTGVGKTVLSASIIASLSGRGVSVHASKPVLTGLGDEPDPVWPPDHQLLARASGQDAAAVARFTYEPAVSPHLAGELAERALEPEALIAAVEAAGRGAEALIVEGVGGLLVPLCDGFDVADLASRLGLGIVVAASPGLGTINHTLLTLEAARRRGLNVLAVVLSGWPEAPGLIERSNLATVAALGRVAVHTLPLLPAPGLELLRAAGDALPLADWLPGLR